MALFYDPGLARYSLPRFHLSVASVLSSIKYRLHF